MAGISITKAKLYALNGSPCYNVNYYNYNSVWLYYSLKVMSSIGHQGNEQYKSPR